MIPLYLKFPSEAEAKQVLADYYSETDGWITASHEYALDPVGVIYKPTGNMIQTEGGEVPEMAPIDGWHVNMMCKAVKPEWEPYIITPVTPSRVFGA